MIYMMYLSGERRKSVTFALDYDSDSELDDCNQGKFSFVDSIVTHTGDLEDDDNLDWEHVTA